jgi:hypothetical protein
MIRHAQRALRAQKALPYFSQVDWLGHAPKRIGITALKRLLLLRAQHALRLKRMLPHKRTQAFSDF